MSARAKLLIASVITVLVLPACGAGGGNVYVGVGVAGPYYGYPGGYGGYPGYVGRPPIHYWDDDDTDNAEELAGPAWDGEGAAEQQGSSAAVGTEETLP